MKYYSKKEVAKYLKVSDATVVKYALLFQKEEYEFITDGQSGSRLFTDKDIELFEQMIALKGVMKIEEAIKQIVKGTEVTLYNSVTPQESEDKLDTILRTVTVIRKENNIIKEELTSVKEELEEHRSLLTNRDAHLMELIRSTQEVKRIQLESLEQTAATQEKKSFREKIKEKAKELKDWYFEN